MAEGRPLEDVVSDAFWSGRRVFLTGHTGFKGSWLALWLARMGAHVTGFALPAEEISLFRMTEVQDLITHVEGDIRDLAAVEQAMVRCAPEVVFHLAAQPLVRESYHTPVETFATNVQGTVHVLEACRRITGLKAVVCVTSDKCYENNEWVWPYREADPMGGHDPYSASKGAAELIISAYRRSFFDKAGSPLLASVRAGNVIGGGDWAKDRLIPDIVRALIASEEPLIRAPGAIRPWQHVLEALGGYLLIAGRLIEGQSWAATAWNFGPADSDVQRVDWIADRLTAQWGAPGWVRGTEHGPHEATILKLDCAKARSLLGWRPALTLADTLAMIVDWHRPVADGANARQITYSQLDEYRYRFRAALAGASIE